MAMTRVVFLDRDGTLNEDRGYVHRIRDWRFTDRAVEAVRMLRDGGFAVALVSNQSGGPEKVSGTVVFGRRRENTEMIPDTFSGP
jgi:HAD superfamily hydrolase (TIGR01662 family)